MENSAKKKLIIVSALLAIGSIVGYLLWKHKKDKATETPSGTPDSGTSLSPNGSTTTGVSPQSTGTSSGVSDVLGFQKWYNKQGYTPKLVEDGVSGPKTNAAYTKYGTAYTKTVPQTTQTSGWKNKDKVYLASSKPQAAIYSYPGTNYVLGSVNKADFLANPIGSYVEPGPKGWVKIVVGGYRPLVSGSYGALKSDVKTVYISEFAISKTPY